jgi:hypothetical protein
MAKQANFAHFAADLNGSKREKRHHAANSARRQAREAPPCWRTNGENERGFCCCAQFATAQRLRGKLALQWRKTVQHSTY